MPVKRASGKHELRRVFGHPGKRTKTALRAGLYPGPAGLFPYLEDAERALSATGNENTKGNGRGLTECQSGGQSIMRLPLDFLGTKIALLSMCSRKAGATPTPKEQSSLFCRKWYGTQHHRPRIKDARLPDVRLYSEGVESFNFAT